MSRSYRKKQATVERVVPIRGMHCNACEVRVSQELEALPGVTRAKVSVASKSAHITATVLPSDAMIEKAVGAAGYMVGYERTSVVATDKRIYRDVLFGAVLVLIGILVAQVTGFVDVAKLTTQSSSVGMAALVVGLTAGISTCMALVGGLVLGISAKHAEQFPSATPLQRFRPHLFFNAGRIVGFTILGLFIGAIGSFFQLSGTVVGWLMILVSVVMIILGLSLTGMFPRLKTLSLPSSVARYLGASEHAKKEYKWHTALFAGVATFFLPCGFTQAMQLMAISSGNPMTGAVIMGMFAVGTTPGLLGIGGLTSFVKGAFAQTFYRVVGVVVVALALVNLTNGATLANLRFPEFRSAGSVVATSADTKRLETTFRVQPDIQPATFRTKVGQKTALVVAVKEEGQGCMSTIMIPGLYDKPLLLLEGKQLVLEFTPKRAGTYQITCAMGIPRGTITVES